MARRRQPLLSSDPSRGHYIPTRSKPLEVPSLLSFFAAREANPQRSSLLKQAENGLVRCASTLPLLQKSHLNPVRHRFWHSADLLDGIPVEKPDNRIAEIVWSFNEEKMTHTLQDHEFGIRYPFSQHPRIVHVL